MLSPLLKRAEPSGTMESGFPSSPSLPGACFHCNSFLPTTNVGRPNRGRMQVQEGFAKRAPPIIARPGLAAISSAPPFAAVGQSWRFGCYVRILDQWPRIQPLLGQRAAAQEECRVQPGICIHLHTVCKMGGSYLLNPISAHRAAALARFPCPFPEGQLFECSLSLSFCLLSRVFSASSCFPDTLDKARASYLNLHPEVRNHSPP